MATVSKRKWTHNGVTSEAWVVRYVDEKGVRRSKQFDHKKVADAFRQKVERETFAGTHVPDAEAETVEALSRAYLVQVEERHRDGRIGRARRDRLRLVVEKNVIPHLGPRRFRDLRAVDVERFFTTLTGAGGLAPHTARDRIQDFKLIEVFARKRGALKSQPVADALTDLRGIARPKIRTFTADEVGALLQAAGAHRRHAKVRASAFLHLAVNLAAFCGLRLGEIRGLTASAIDFDARLIRVRHSLTNHDVLKGPKTIAGIRDIPLPGHIAGLLREWLATHAVIDPRGLIFRTASGGDIDNGNLHYSWRALLKTVGLDHADRPFHFHALRHFCASWMIENGLPLTDVAALLGHSKFDMTLQVYAHSVVKPAMRHDAIERMVAQLPGRDGATVTQRLIVA